MPAPDPRPSLTPALDALVADLIEHIDALDGIDARTIVVVALGAHATAAASVRSLDDVARAVLIGGARKRIELGLRPPFFLEGDAARRLATLVHELLHVDAAHAGRLLEQNKHAHKSHAALEREARALTTRYLEHADRERLLCLAHDGEVLMRQWKHRPADTTSARRFGDRDVFEGPIRLVTPRSARAGWW